MKYQEVGVGEYDLMKEEYLYESTPSDLGIAVDKNTGRREPAIVLRQPLKNKKSLKLRDIETSWTLAQESGKVEMLFLTINFKLTEEKDAEQIRVCIDKFNHDVMDWFRLLIDTKGELVLNDSMGDVQAIMVTGVPLDLPRAILAQAQVQYEAGSLHRGVKG